ncbi:hypothetical protein [Levilactobacillus fujinensis]|uniref:Uncharacterized protein n=1 Tax=Levilactobacillus fujinensis TaxID=2486024 RepID=A0ABW1TDS0_9LACO|nr:hypothetical protein [Levilactobacillus fujinensis]
MMTSNWQKAMMGLLATLSLAAMFLMIPATHAQAAQKQLTAIPKQLQGYWYTYGTKTKNRHASDLVYLHVTAHEIDSSVISRKTMKLGLQTFNSLNLNPGSPITQKLKANRTNTFYRVSHNRWNQHALFVAENGDRNYITGRYALKTKKGQTSLFFQGSSNPRKFNTKPVAAHERLHAKRPTIKYTKISQKYLHSIGIFD